LAAHVVDKIVKSRIDSVITRRSAEDLKLKKGYKVIVSSSRPKSCCRRT